MSASLFKTNEGLGIMKNTLLALFLAGLLQNGAASEIYVTPTKNGGEITLTFDTPDSCDGLFFMYVISNNQEPVYGCWAFLNGMIHVRYENGVRRVYDDFGWIRRESM